MKMCCCLQIWFFFCLCVKSTFYLVRTVWTNNLTSINNKCGSNSNQQSIKSNGSFEMLQDILKANQRFINCTPQTPNFRQLTSVMFYYLRSHVILFIFKSWNHVHVMPNSVMKQVLDDLSAFLKENVYVSSIKYGYSIPGSIGLYSILNSGITSNKVIH
jgi:hypothetical protein